MINHYSILASLGSAVLFSPEVTAIGLVAASHRHKSQLCSWVFGIGTILGLTFALILGFIFAQTHITVHHEVTWRGFAVRIAIALALFIIGFYRLVITVRGVPIKKPKKIINRKLLHFMRDWFSSHFPKSSKIFGNQGELSNSQLVIRWGLLGFYCGGLHPKIFPIVVAAGHQTLLVSSVDTRIIGLVIFLALAMIPGFVPAIMETIHPGIAVRAREGFENFMKRYGQHIAVVLILTVAVIVSLNAKNNMPKWNSEATITLEKAH